MLELLKLEGLADSLIEWPVIQRLTFDVYVQISGRVNVVQFFLLIAMIESKHLFPAQNINHSHPLVAVAQEQELLVGRHLELSQPEAFSTLVWL